VRLFVRVPICIGGIGGIIRPCCEVGTMVILRSDVRMGRSPSSSICITIGDEVYADVADILWFNNVFQSCRV
jgi:hypothetical protein